MRSQITIQQARQKAQAWLTRLAGGKKTAPMVSAVLLAAPAISYAQVSVQKPAQAMFQMVAIGFASIAALGIVFCTIAGIFGFAQWTRLLNIMGWTAAGGGGLALASWAVSAAI